MIEKRATLSQSILFQEPIDKKESSHRFTFRCPKMIFTITIFLVILIALMWAISVYLHKRLKKKPIKVVSQVQKAESYEEENAFITDVT